MSPQTCHLAAVGIPYAVYVQTYLCMYVCMYKHIYVCMYKHIYVCMYVCMYVQTYLCMYVQTYLCMYVCTDIFMYVYMYVQTHFSLDTCAPKMCRRDGFRDVCLVLYCTARQDTFDSVQVTSNYVTVE
jgi:hypothetical protein